MSILHSTCVCVFVCECARAFVCVAFGYVLGKKIMQNAFYPGFWPFNATNTDFRLGRKIGCGGKINWGRVKNRHP